MLSRLLIATGVSVWVPFIWATAAGKHVSILPYLAVHLPCILAGAWLKKRNTDLLPRSDLSRTQKLGNLLLLIGIGAWVPYFLIKNTLEAEVTIQPFLIVHLSGILGGILVRLNIIGKFLQRLDHPMIREKNL
jgi:hypothetical protein